MSIRNRLKKLERKMAPQNEYTPKEDQKKLLEAFIEIETVFNGRPPTDEEIEALVAAYESGELDADNPLITDRLRREKKDELSDMMDDLSETDREEKASSRRR